MGSKKHKKESKKKKHRSRSRSPLEGEERERKRHRKHKDRKKARSPDVEEVPVDSHLQKNEGNGVGGRGESEERERRMREHHRSHRDSADNYSYERDHDKERGRERVRESERERERSPAPPPVAAPPPPAFLAPTPPPPASGSAQESLSIEETNRLRVKLGLKPLQVTEKPPEDDGKLKDDLGEFYHKPAANISQQKKSEKIKQKLEERKEKRRLEQKLQTTTLLADSSDDDGDPTSWVQKSREIEKQRKEAAKRAAMLDEMDEVFGVSALVAEEEREARAAQYSASQLRGLRVAHDLEAIGDERETVLTLADKDVLAEDDEDVLVNVNIVDDERYKKNLSELKKARSGYKAYDDEADLEAMSLGLQRPVLAKYDEEIDKESAQRQRGFFIGDDHAVEAANFKRMMRQEMIAGGANKRLESLQLPALRPANDYLDEHEIQAKFKKVKRKGKMRKRAKEEPIDVDDYDAGAIPLDTDDTAVKVEMLGVGAVVEEEEETELDVELQAALARARRMRLRQAEAEAQAQPNDSTDLDAQAPPPPPPPPTLPKIEEILEQVKKEELDEELGGGSAMVLDATAEFCRTLGDIPTYGLAGNRDRNTEIIDFERDMEMDVEAEANAGAWSRVDVDSEKPPDLVSEKGGAGGVGLEAEPALGLGVAGALRLALSKGYLDRAGANAHAPALAPANASASARAADAQNLLAARHYSIEDKTYGEDDKYGRRERGGGHSGPLQDFREKSNFKPNIKLEYVDDDGRPLRPKEAFRYLSHKFHGKGPGKNKQEKRIKKAVQEGLMKKMSSTDTPLGTLQMLQEKQKETQSPYIVLSGAKRDANH